MSLLSTKIVKTKTGNKKFYIYVFSKEEYENIEEKEMIKEITYYLGNTIEMEGEGEKANEADERFLFSLGCSGNELDTILYSEKFLIITSEFL